MARPKRRIRWRITVVLGRSLWWCSVLRQWQELIPRGPHNLSSQATARTKKQAYRIAAKALAAGAPSVHVVFCCPRRSRKWPRGFESDYVLNKELKC